MLELLQMWALVEVLGIVCLPLTITVFHNLPDRGWAFSKALAIAVFAFCVWFPLMCIHALPFSKLFIAGVALILLAFSVLGMFRIYQELVKIISANLLYIIAVEVAFLGMVFLLGFLRSFGPNIQFYEAFMDEGFIASIMRSVHFPPNDMWYAGGSLNYYYYAHFTIAMLAKLLGQSPSIAFNTGISIFFGLTAVSLLGVTCNIVAWARYLRRAKKADPAAEIVAPDTVLPALLPALPYGILTMAMGLLLGNLAATQQWFQNHGQVFNYDWFGASRVIQNTITEFPAFSFLLSCFHAHVLALAFTIVSIGLAFNLFLEKDGKGIFAFGRGWHLPMTLGSTALVLGGLFTMNGWDFPTYLGLAVLCIGLQQWLVSQRNFRLAFLLDLIIPIGSLVGLSLLLYLPFYLSFSSPSQGLGLLPAQRSRISDELLIYGLFAFVFLSLLLASALKHPLFERSERSESVPDQSQEEMSFAYNVGDGQEEPEQESSEPATQSSTMSYSLFVRLILIGAYLLASFAVLKFVPNSATFVVGSCLAVLALMLLFYHLKDRSHAFILLLGVIAFALVAGCEIFFLKDAFAGGDDERMNTVFKFYFQAWALLSIASGAAIFFILESFRPVTVSSLTMRWLQWGMLVLWSAFMLILLLASTAYPLVAPYARFAKFDPQTQHYTMQRTNSLDGLTYLQNDAQSLGDYRAICWLNANVEGDPVLVEAFGDDYGVFARISAFTGLPTIMGWAGHEVQWRLNWLNIPANSIAFNRRSNDIKTIYTASSSALVLSTMKIYSAQYLYVGLLEHQKYPGVDLHRFNTFMQVVYNANGVTIYKVR